MSKKLPILLTISIVVITAATLNISGAQARDWSELIELGLPLRQADYGVDVDYGVIPVISLDIVLDELRGYDLLAGEIHLLGSLDDDTTVTQPPLGQGNENLLGGSGAGGECNGVGNPDCLGKGNCYGVGNPNCLENKNSNGNAYGRLKNNGSGNGNGGMAAGTVTGMVGGTAMVGTAMGMVRGTVTGMATVMGTVGTVTATGMVVGTVMGMVGATGTAMAREIDTDKVAGS